MTTEHQVNALAELARQAFLDGNRDSAVAHVTEAIGILAEQASVDASPLLDLLTEVLS